MGDVVGWCPTVLQWYDIPQPVLHPAANIWLSWVIVKRSKLGGSYMQQTMHSRIWSRESC